MTLELQYYVDLPGRDLTIPDAGSVVWIDIEPGCFQDAQAVRDQGTANTAAGMVTGIYCSRNSLPPVFGDSTELADYPLPLWVADYRPPHDFIPFSGWTTYALWQYWSNGYLGVNCDLSITPDGRLFADISNFSSLTQRQADYFKTTLSGVVIGLQNAAIARKFKEQLT